MVVRIRLVPVGKKSQLSYHINVIDSRKPRESGNYLKNLGYWNPGQKKLELNQEEYQKWLKWGAQPSDSLNVRYNKQVIINTLENLPANQIKIQVPKVDSRLSQEEKVAQETNNFQVKDLKKKLKENNYWLIKRVLLDKWEKGLVEKIFKSNRFRIGKILFFTDKTRTTRVLGEEEKIPSSLNSFNFEFSISLPKESKPAALHTTKNNPLSILEVRNKQK